jgi:molybdate transport system substrate-binding protein
MRLASITCCAGLLALSLAASAAEITVYSGGAAKVALSEVATRYEKATGERVVVDYAPMGALMRRLADGARPDVVVLTADVIDEAGQRNWIQPETATPLGGIGIGVAVREGAPLPDVSTPAALKATLLAAKSITYMDPAKGTSGKHFAEVLKSLGIADAVKGKTTLGETGYVVEPVARGEIEIGVQQISEILPVKGAQLVGPLPPPFQKITVYTAVIGANAPHAADAQKFIAYLREPAVRQIFIDKGFLAP